MNTVELFCGLKSFSKYAAKLNHDTYTVDIDASFEPSLVHDLLLSFPQILIDYAKEADVIWMSPPCTTFSMASGNKHWTADRCPKTSDATEGFMLLMVCERLADYCVETGKIFFIENPRARARWFLPIEWRHTVWYCQYGDMRAKPTDIWTNLRNWDGKQCFNGNKQCHHQPAPRGSKTGTQALSPIYRSKIPEGLFVEVFDNMDESRLI